jgi:hypothetical protein
LILTYDRILTKLLNFLQKPHYAVSYKEWEMFESILVTDHNITRKNNRIIYFSSATYSQTYDNIDDYITVINLDINDVTINQNPFIDYFKRINFEELYGMLNKTSIHYRGNYHISLGYSTLNITDVDPITFIRRPALNKNTEEIVNVFVIMSKILSLFKNTKTLLNTYNHRLSDFAKKIDSNNSCEGINIAYTRINKENTQYYNRHVDSYNSPLPLLNYLLIAGHIMNINGIQVRVSVIAYSRKSIDEYVRIHISNRSQHYQEKQSNHLLFIRNLLSNIRQH